MIVIMHEKTKLPYSFQLSLDVHSVTVIEEGVGGEGSSGSV
jgi:hypothetical protein